MSPIQALPPVTVRQIGSTQSITGPTSAVKELVDNALDARASAISIEISSNTVDLIHVRDNGHGIAAEDRPLVCRRYCTSKLKDYSELEKIGGACLGFRGEALASLAEVAGGLAVVTRVEGEGVAVRLDVGREGEVMGESSASHPVGTSVRAENLFAALPVRKQNALKDTVRTLAKIKRMLQAYALARPTVRFSLKVLKAKNDSGNLTYVPKPGSEVEDAAFKLFGSACASQCQWSVLGSQGFELQAFLPKPSAEAAKVGTLGQLVSVDSRPVSHSRRILKQIVILFKEKLRESSSQLEQVKDPFLCLNILCPAGSYDPNIEPAKDDVLFYDSEALLSAVKELLGVIYPTPEPHPERQDSLKRSAAGTPSHAGRSEVLPSLKSRPPQHFRSMFGQEDDTDDIAQTLRKESSSPVSGEADGAENLRDPKIFNPWSLAKMNAPMERKSVPTDNDPYRLGAQSRDGDEEMEDFPPEGSQRRSDAANFLPTPMPSSSPYRRDVPDRAYHCGLGQSLIQDNGAAEGFSMTPSSRPAGSIPAFNPESSPCQGASQRPINIAPLQNGEDFGTPLSSIPGSIPKRGGNRRKQAPKRQKIPLINDLTNVWFHDTLNPPSSSQRARPALQEYNHDIRDVIQKVNSRRSEAESNAELNAEERESRVDRFSSLPIDEALPGRGWLRETSPLSDADRTARKRQASPLHELQEKRTNNWVAVNSVPPATNQSPPPAKRRRTTESRLTRTKSSLLSLERVPDGANIQNLEFIVDTTAEKIKDQLEAFDMEENYVDWGCEPYYETFSVRPTLDEVVAWSEFLRSVLKESNLAQQVPVDIEGEMIVALERIYDVPHDVDDEDDVAGI
ncbi:hypothetical protein K402DRAFT_390533 [Aulographum hederae CBS 113979]|uniref:DNA mismatch repair protein S5 domain-containing protein n=1 Tax=Aulographum hederae CBS 113979 TaxID=1176131 RepID=A0A6G1H8L6_9PEZI|nr:hypothetical protein K402DRAFT_390533 [Aulographum hederae CBS 113979]